MKAQNRKFPTILLNDQYYKSEVGEFAEDMTKDALDEPSNSWLTILGASECVMWLLDLSQAISALRALSRRGAVPAMFTFDADEELHATGNIIEGYKIAVLAASRMIEKKLIGVEQQGLSKADRRTIARLLARVKSRQTDFARELAVSSDPEKLYNLFQLYGRTNRSIRELCSKLLVNKLRGDLERLIVYDIPSWNRKRSPNSAR